MVKNQSDPNKKTGSRTAGTRYFLHAQEAYNTMSSATNAASMMCCLPAITSVTTGALPLAKTATTTLSFPLLGKNLSPLWLMVSMTLCARPLPSSFTITIIPGSLVGNVPPKSLFFQKEACLNFLNCIYFSKTLKPTSFLKKLKK